LSYAGLGISRLPFDVERCLGNGCGVKDDCLRHVAITTACPRTPFRDCCCNNVEEREAFILAAKESAHG
jgi:hypothetical protein